MISIHINQNIQSKIFKMIRTTMFIVVLSSHAENLPLLNFFTNILKKKIVGPIYFLQVSGQVI